MLVFKDRPQHNISALKRISYFTLCSPYCQEKSASPNGKNPGTLNLKRLHWRVRLAVLRLEVPAPVLRSQESAKEPAHNVEA
jgi:hypothetical protein